MALVRFVALAATSVVLSVGSPAFACGGLFCSQSAPVDQTAERIVFAKNPDDTITSIVEIAYSGPAERFAWVLPIPGVPEVGLSSTNALDAIQVATAPNYQLNTRVVGKCDERPPNDRWRGFADAGAEPGTLEYAEASPVLVLAAGTVGPFDYVVLEPNEELTDKAEVALEWLDANGYDVGSLGPEVLRPYLDTGLNLLAFRLTKGSSTGSIRPVMLTYDGPEISIPLRPTAVAARPNMGIFVWVLGDARAVPANYFLLTLNEARIDWFNPSGNYRQLVTEAADEAGGQGFVTEYAGTSGVLGQVFHPLSRSAWKAIEASTAEGSDLLREAAVFLGPFDGFFDAMGASVTPPPGVTLDRFLANPTDYLDDPQLMVDVEGFKDALWSFVVEPLKQTQKVIDASPYVTRLYTTMSAEEMQVDPLFELNPNLEDVSNQHQAEVVVHCSSNYYRDTAPSTLTLPSGRAIELGATQQMPDALANTPANSKIAQASASEPITISVDNNDDIDDVIASLPKPPTTPHEPASSYGFCAARKLGGPYDKGLLAMLLASAIGVAAHKRRKRPSES